MESSELTIEILRGIRDEVREVKGQLVEVKGQLVETNGRIDRTNERLDHVVQAHIQLATEVVAVASAVRDLSALLREDRDLRVRVDDHERRLRRIERVG